MFPFPIDLHITLVQRSTSFALLSVLSSFLSLPAAPPAGKTEKDSIGAKPVVHTKGPGFSPEHFFQGPMEGMGNMGNLKGRDLTFLNIYYLSPSGKGQAPVFDVFEAFLNTDNIQVFANAATSYIMCLMKFVKGLGKWSPPFITCDSRRCLPAWLCVVSLGDRPTACLEQASKQANMLR